MFKAIVSDLDGTLLNAEHKVSEFTRETVKLLLQKGIKFYIATGRNYLGAKEAMDELGVKIPLITSHGSAAFDENGNEIFSKDCDKAVAAGFLLLRDGLTLQDAVSFGDGFNDYDLITQTGLGFAMKNSIYRLLEKLTDTEIVGSNASDGMAKKVREIFNL